MARAISSPAPALAAAGGKTAETPAPNIEPSPMAVASNNPSRRASPWLTTSLPGGGLQLEGQHRAEGDGALGVPGQVPRDRFWRDHRVAPLVQSNQLGHQLGAQPVAVAFNHVDR